MLGAQEEKLALLEQRMQSAVERTEVAEQRLQQRRELDMERLKAADDRQAIWEQLAQARQSCAAYKAVCNHRCAAWRHLVAMLLDAVTGTTGSCRAEGGSTFARGPGRAGSSEAAA